MTIEDKFWSKVEKGESCWLWTGAHLKRGGYGQFTAFGQSRAHRVSWILCRGDIPTGLQVLHHCDTPACVRPDHLFLGTNDDNVADKMRKGRHWSGKGDRHGMRLHPEKAARGYRNGAYTKPERRRRAEEHGQAKLNWPAVWAIRACYSTRVLTQYQLANAFLISQRQIGRIVNRRSWEERG